MCPWRSSILRGGWSTSARSWEYGPYTKGTWGEDLEAWRVLSSQRAQPAYYCYVPAPRERARPRIITSNAVRFVIPLVFPGLRRSAWGGWIVPFENTSHSLLFPGLRRSAWGGWILPFENTSHSNQNTKPGGSKGRRPESGEKQGRGRLGPTRI